ncbi:MAG: c-type cytochrome [Oligoflexia bacterium]|nr:c-type cytochrome [Oligoflexia bacterium]
MSIKKEDQLLDHEYDGIKEYDNLLPSWWLATFYGAIVFSFLYMGYYHFAGGPSLSDELQQDLAEIYTKRKSLEVKDNGPTEEALAAILADKSRVDQGKVIYVGKCASCHGNLGEGLIGPNLTDNYWLHGDASLMSILLVVADGVAEKGMPPWKGMMKKDEVQSVVVYVKSLKGTNPSNPKAPQGEEVKN